MSARSVIEHALTAYYADSQQADQVVRVLLHNYNHDHRAEVLAEDGQAYDGELAMLRGLVATLHAVAMHGDLSDVRKLLAEHTTDDTAARLSTGEEATAEAAPATPTDTNRRARLLHAIADGGRWKSGDVVRWYETQGLTGFGVRAARHDLAVLRDSGAITQHDERGVRFYTLREDGRS